jgi:3-oxoadipate enol-lactonase
VLAALHPERVERLLLVSTACVTHSDRARLWNERIAKAASGGMQSVAEEAVRRWFADPFQKTHRETVLRWERIVAQTSLAGYVGIAKTIEQMDLRPLLGKIQCPTWVLSGALDAATGSATGNEIARGIPGAIHRIIDEAGHLWNLESPRLFRRELESWLQTTTPTRRA